MRSFAAITLSARPLLALCFAVAACSKTEAPQTDALASGPSIPELAFRTDVSPIESAPISLTASDGQGLQLVAFEARTVLEDPLAFTELHLTFHNPEQRRREGRFEIVLPPAAAVSRFAMRTSAGWQEGEVVERARAQQVYEDFLHRKQDPALLENDAGNEFAARVFPIEAGADKEIILSYSEERPLRNEPYRLPLRGLPTLDRFDVQVSLGASSSGANSDSRSKNGVLEVHERNYEPTADLEVRLPSARPFALRHGSLVVARVTPIAKVELETFNGLTILFDTSGSRAAGFGAQIERTAELLTDLAQRSDKDFDVRVVAFDQDVEEIYRGSARAFSLRDKGKLLERGAFGASNLEQALAYLAKNPDGHERVLLVSDGVITAGEEDSLRLREAVTKLAAHGVRRLDALVEGGIRDEGTLQALTQAGLSSSGSVLDARMVRSVLADKLTRTTRAKIAVHMPAATWIEPAVIEGAQAGDEYLIFAELPEGAPVQIELDDGTAQQIDTMEASQALLERAWARAKISALTRRAHGLEADPTLRQKARDEIIALSVAHRVVSEYTALLVLETADDYRRFGIAQRSLSDILTIGREGLTTLERSAPPRLELAVDEPQAKGEIAQQETAPMFEAQAAPAEGPSDDRADEAKRSRSPSTPASMPAGRGAVAEPDERESPARSAPRPPSLDIPPPSPAKASLARAGGAAVIGGSLSDAVGSSGFGGALRSAPNIAERAAQPEVEIAAPSYGASVGLRNLSFSGLDPVQTSSVLRTRLNRAVQRCYAEREPPVSAAQLTLALTVDARGSVVDVSVQGSLGDPALQACALSAARSLQFPKPTANFARVEATLSITRRQETMIASATPARPRAPRPRVNVAEPRIEDAYDGVLATVLEALRREDVGTALIEAKRAHDRDPSDVMALTALGETLEAQHDDARAARVYGSIIDLFPSRADLRRMAGSRLERLSRAALPLAIDSYKRAVQQRPDHPSGHRLLAYAMLKQDDPAGAFGVLQSALAREYPADRFLGVPQILREDLGLVAAAWLRAKPGEADRIREALSVSGAVLDKSPSLRFVLNWETDANDVDFHIYDGQGGHASYLKPRLASGGKLYADVTTGYGPECFAIPSKARAYPYTLQAHYFQRGPMGYGMGKLQIVEHDGHGTLRFAEHPFVIMKDKAYVALARLTGPLSD